LAKPVVGGLVSTDASTDCAHCRSGRLHRGSDYSASWSRLSCCTDEMLWRSAAAR